MLSLAAQRDQPQDGGERAGDGEVWSEVDPDQDRAGNMRRHLRGLADGRSNQPRRKVVDEVRCDGDDDPGDPACALRRSRRSIFQDAGQRRQHTGPVQPFDQDEQPRHQREHRP